jgi:hypothetical protein
MTEKMVTEKESTEFGRKKKDESHIHYRSNNWQMYHSKNKVKLTPNHHTLLLFRVTRFLIHAYNNVWN